MVNEPLYDEDLVNLGYLNTRLEGTSALLLSQSQNFGTLPTTPYYKYNTYMGTDGIYICINERLIGDYNANDWTKASTYVNVEDAFTQGIVTAGLLQAVNGGSYAAGITGEGTGDASVRIWAGSTFADRADAPFRVTQGGAVNASNINISGGFLSWNNLNVPTKNDLGNWTTYVDDTGIYTGTLTANQINVSGINATNITTGTLNGSTVNITNLNASNINTGTLSANRINGGAINAASSVTVGGFTIGNSSFSGSTSKGSLLMQRGSSAAIDFPCNGGRLMLSSSSGSANVALTSAGGSGTDGMCISDSYGATGSGASGYSIGIRGLYGSVRTAVSSPYVVRLERTGGAYVEVGANVNLQGGYVQIESVQVVSNTFTGSGGAQHYSNTNCMFNPADGYYAYINSVTEANRIATSSSGPSSRNVKKNIKTIKQQEYKNLYEDLQKLELHTFDYKYSQIKNETSDFGFIIDEIEELSTIAKYTKHYNTEGFIRNKRFVRQRENDTKQEKYKKLKYKEWDRDSYIKTSLMLIKSMQIKIDDLETKINKLEGGK